jgi:hypothetical protein
MNILHTGLHIHERPPIMKICISGPPRSGKSILSDKMGKNLSIPVFHCDDLISTHSWSEASDFIASDWMNRDSFIIEGVQVARALRKWLIACPNEKPCDTLYILNTPFIKLTPKQESMNKGIISVTNEILSDIRTRAVRIINMYRSNVEYYT